MADGSPRRLGVDAGVPSARQGGTRRLPGEMGLVLREGTDGSVDGQFGGRDGEIPNCPPRPGDVSLARMPQRTAEHGERPFHRSGRPRHMAIR
jgi:hypothetical protein